MNAAKLSAALVAVLALPMPAAAMLVSGSGAPVLSAPPTGSVTVSGDTFAFDWDDTPFSGFVDFEAASPFFLVFDSYDTPVTSGSLQSGLLFEEIDSLGGSSTGLGLLTTEFVPSSGSPALPEFLGGVDLIGPASNTGVINPSASPLFSSTVLPAGFYRIGVFDSAIPQEATVVFSVVAIPEVTPLLFGLIGTGYLGLKRRRMRS